MAERAVFLLGRVGAVGGIKAAKPRLITRES